MKVKELYQLFQQNQQVENQSAMSAYMRDQFSFFGLKAERRRDLQKDFIQNHKSGPVDWSIIGELWELEERELQYVGLDLLKAKEKNYQIQDLDSFYQIITQKSWWDTVDPLAKNVGCLALAYPNPGKKQMESWAEDDNLWIRRTAIIHQLAYKEETDEDLLATCIQKNLGSEEFFINKAIGWALREYSKTRPDFVRSFIKEHEQEMAKLSIREGSKRL